MTTEDIIIHIFWVLLEFPWKPLYAGLSYNVTVSTE